MNLADLPIRCNEDEDRGVKSKWPRNYTGWGPYEDYMCTRSERGWNSRIVQTCDQWFNEDEGEPMIPEFNVVVDFYFAIDHQSKPCKDCEEVGYNPETTKISNDFYDFSKRGTRWCDKITQDEVQALCDEHRIGGHYDRDREEWVLDKVPTAEEINAQNRPEARGFGHDAINRHILIETRAKRLGVYGLCEKCGGHGRIRTSDDYYSLYLWLTHPRKGASRGVHLTHVRDEHMPKIREMLLTSWNTLKERFAWAVDKPEWVYEEEEDE